MKNLDWGFYEKNFSWVYILFIGNTEWKAKLLNMWYVHKRLSNFNWNFITEIQCTADRSDLCFFIHFYYSQIMRTFSRSFYCFLFKLFFNNCDVMIIHPITFRNYKKHPIKVSRNKNNIMYISLIENIRSSLIHLHGFQLLVLLP